jgi:hypothetical protein
MADKDAPSQDCGLHPFEDIAAQPLDSWKPVNDESATPYVKILARRRLPSYPRMVSRELIPSTTGYLGGSSLYSIVIT